ncbi:conjugal transfer protein [Oligella urethralis]|uniref:VirB4 family type IV secretion/conjugal transfer ATPase n=1 Tax=Oligella urethralis TaxID=90245 RepID=UPI0027B9271A|nr:conjugal transfer protein [Oligella urethralis]
MIIADFLKRTFAKLGSQPAHVDFLPKFSQHVTEDIVHIKKGYLGFIVQFQGIPFESEDDSHINAQFANLALSLAVIGKTLGNRLSLWTTLKRRKRVFDRHYTFDNMFCQEFATKYLERFKDKPFFSNSFYISFILKYEDFTDGLKEAEDLKAQLTSNLQNYEPYVLKTYENEHGIIFSEVYEFLASLINYERQPIPLTTSDASSVLGDSDLHFGADICEIRTQNKVKFATMFDLKDFGTSKPKILTQILDLPCEFNLTQSFTYVNSHDMLGLVDRQLNNLISSGDQARQQHEELQDGKGKLTAGELMFGDYHAALVVYGDTPHEASNNGNMTTSRFLNTGGFIFKKAGFSAPYTYYSQVPGAEIKPRATPKTTLNLATTFGMHTYSQGKTWGNPLGDGLAVMPLQTRSNTVFDFNFHYTSPKENNVGDKIAGHTLILGATGAGKTTVETALMAFTERFNPHIFALDLDAGMQIFIQAIGGSYHRLNTGVPTGLNPFQLKDSPGTREFLYTLVGLCGKNSQGQITADEEKQIKMAVDTLMNQVPFEHRNFSVMLQNIPATPDENSLRSRLSRWCRSEGGRFAWCLDNPTNHFDPDSFYKVGFDLTDILQDNYAPTEPVLAYMFFLRDQMMDRVAEEGGILATIVEEFWWPTRFKVTEELILKILKTDRKRSGWIILTSQSPEDAIQCSIFPAIAQQTPTKIFLPNPDAEYKDSYEKCGISYKEFEEIKKLHLDSRTFLIKQNRQSAFATLDLYGFNEELAVLSGTSENVEVLNQLLEQMPGAKPDEWYPVFKQRILARKEEKQQRLLNG